MLAEHLGVSKTFFGPNFSLVKVIIRFGGNMHKNFTPLVNIFLYRNDISTRE